MFKDINNFESFAPRRGLYRVWIRAHEGQNAPLVSVWIDPAMTAFEPRADKQAYVLPIASTVSTGHDRQLQEKEEVACVKRPLSPVPAATVADSRQVGGAASAQLPAI